LIPIERRQALCPLSVNGGSWWDVSGVDVFGMSIPTNFNFKNLYFKIIKEDIL
jgi:hypothetical protein